MQTSALPGLLAAGYDLVTLGGIGYANGSTFPDGQQGWGPGGPGNITRNASGHLQVTSPANPAPLIQALLRECVF